MCCLGRRDAAKISIFCGYLNVTRLANDMVKVRVRIMLGRVTAGYRVVSF